MAISRPTTAERAHDDFVIYMHDIYTSARPRLPTLTADPATVLRDHDRLVGNL
jgi:hypothetical protein